MALYRKRRRRINNNLSFKELQEFPKSLIDNMVGSTGLSKIEFAYKASLSLKELGKCIRHPKTMTVSTIIKFVDVVKSQNPAMRNLTSEEFFVAITLLE